MPSTLVHLALGALLAAGLLDDEFDGRTLGLVLAVTAVPDLDTFAGLWLAGTHRALLHNALVPLLLGALVYSDTRVAPRSWLASRGAVRLAWVCVAAYAFAGVGPDLVTNGVNLFYPVVDRFVSLSGQVLISDQRGLVQTLW
ncbi:MAG: metal-dependent hydrolase, partial [Halobacteriales archaeon]